MVSKDAKKVDELKLSVLRGIEKKTKNLDDKIHRNNRYIQQIEQHLNRQNNMISDMIYKRNSLWGIIDITMKQISALMFWLFIYVFSYNMLKDNGITSYILIKGIAWMIIILPVVIILSIILLFVYDKLYN